MMSSVSGKGVSPLLGPYSGSKFALEALSDALRMELLRSGIKVAIIEPASIRTPIWHKSLAAAEAVAGSLPPAAEQIYGAPMRNLRKIVADTATSGAPVSVVTRAVAHALTAPPPQDPLPSRHRARAAPDACQPAAR